MQIVVDDLLCPSCDGYVHPFLEACPACGTARTSRFEEVAATGTLGAGALLEDEGTRRAAHLVVLRYTMRATSASGLADLDAAFGAVAASLTYRAEVTADGSTPALPSGPATLDDAKVVLVRESLEVRAGRSGRSAATIPLASVLAATPAVKGAPGAGTWTGAVLGGRRLLERGPLVSGDLLVTFSSGGGAGQIALSNRRGLFAPTARADHYATLARWLAILGAAAAETRWTDVGPTAYAAELGLRDAVQGPVTAIERAPAVDPADAGRTAARAAPDGRSDGSAPAAGRAGTPQPGVRAALEELEGLRAAGLVTAAEYDAKRREILARL